MKMGFLNLKELAIGLLLVFLYTWYQGGCSREPSVATTWTEHEIRAPISRVWEVVTDWEDQGDWRSDLKSVEVLSGDRFVEHLNSGSEVTFEVTSTDAPNQILLEMSGGATGTYEIELVSQGDITKVVFRESVELGLFSGSNRSRVLIDTNRLRKACEK